MRVINKAAGAFAKGFDVLDIVAAAGTASVADLAREAEIPSSTAYRIVRELTERGLLMSPMRGRYALGPATWRLGAAISLEQILANLLAPRLIAFSRRYGVHAHLGVLENDMVTYLVRCAAGPHPIAAVENAQLEAYCSGIGKVLLAHAPDDQLSAYLERGGFIALTPRTVVSAAMLATELASIRTQGWAIDDEEIVTGLRCVAVPIRDALGQTFAAISASGSCEVMTMDRIDRLRGRLEVISADIAKVLAPYASSRSRGASSP